MSTPELQQFRPQGAQPKILQRTAPDRRNDGTINTWAGGDVWLWKVARELHEYDLRERDVPERRRGARGQAKAIIEGRARWPVELLAWKRFTELTYYRLSDGPWGVKRALPPWLLERNLTPPQRACMRARAAEIEADIAREKEVEGALA